MAMASGIGARLASPPAGPLPHAFWFGEDQARYVLTAKVAEVPKIAAAAAENGIPISILGTTAGKQLTLPGEDPILVSSLHALFEGWLPVYMAGGTAR
jgi:phosphoribosylformylglycinamidine synthase